MQRKGPPKDEARRAAWFDAYVTTVLRRDVRERANIDRLADLPRLLGQDASRLAQPHAFGPLLESFVVGELEKLAAASNTRASLYHYRNLAQREVDIVMESADGRVIGIELKSTTHVEARDFAGLRALADDAGDRFAYGIVLHASESLLSFGKAFQAAPISLLWRAA